MKGVMSVRCLCCGSAFAAKKLRSRLGGRDDRGVVVNVTCRPFRPKRWDPVSEDGITQVALGSYYQSAQSGRKAEHLMAHYFCRRSIGSGIIAVVSPTNGCAK